MYRQPVYDTVNSESHEYEYDGFNRLIKEVFDGVEYRYSYDAAGNILSKEEYRNGTLDKSYNFVYNTSIKNRLVRINSYRSTDTVQNSFTECTYDALGLPTKYRNINLTWDKRNQLASYNGVTYTYDGSGMRLTKGSKVYEYDGDTLLSETNGNEVIKFIYGISGLIGFLYNGTPYYYVRNMLGDVKSIKDANGNLVAEYKYDAWGNCTIASQTGLYLGTKNPIRYRGYFYDEETGLYYLQTRYYDPDIGRFISPDNTKYLEPGILGGLNLYAYCNNNPVMYTDPSGHFAISVALFVGTIVIGALIGGGSAAYSSIKKGDEWYEVALKTISGAALGGMLGAAMGTGAALAAGGTIAGLSAGASVAVGMGITVGGSAVLGATNSFVNQIIDNDWNINKISISRIGSDALVAGIKGLLSFGTGAWTGAAGLWNIPKGAAPGFMNFSTKTILNTVIGTGWKLSVNIIYATLLGEELGWIKGLESVVEWLL